MIIAQVFSDFGTNTGVALQKVSETIKENWGDKDFLTIFSLKHRKEINKIPKAIQHEFGRRIIGFMMVATMVFPETNETLEYIPHDDFLAPDFSIN